MHARQPARRPALPTYFADFFVAAFFGADFFGAVPSSPSARPRTLLPPPFTFFGFASFFGRSGALKSSARRTRSQRCARTKYGLPVSAEFLVLLLALVMEDQNLCAAALANGVADDTSIGLMAHLGLPRRKPRAPGTQPDRQSRRRVSPTRITSPGATRYCFPPARITAYIRQPPSNVV